MSAATSSTGGDGSECRWAADPGLRAPEPGGVQLGHQPAMGDRDRPGQDQRGRGPVLHRDPERPPGWNWNTGTSIGTDPSREARHDGVDGNEGWPLYLARYAALVGTAADGPHHHDHRDRPAGRRCLRLRHRPDPVRRVANGVVDGHMDHIRHPRAGDRCPTTRRIGGANRPATSPVTPSTHPEPGASTGSTDPIRATVDLTVEPLTATDPD